MNHDQLQDIRNIKYKIVSSLVDIADNCSSIEIDPQTPKSLINMLDDTFRLIYSTPDSDTQTTLLKNFFNTDFQKLIKWKNEVYPTFERKAKEIKTNTIEAFKNNLQIDDEMNQKFTELNALDDPFRNVDNDFFNFQNFTESLPVKGPFPFLEPIYKQIKNYEAFFSFIKFLRLIQKYNESDKTDFEKLDDNSNSTEKQSSENSPKADDLPKEKASTNLPKPVPIPKLQNWKGIKLNNDSFHQKNQGNDNEGKHHGLLSLSGFSLPQPNPKLKKPVISDEQKNQPNIEIDQPTQNKNNILLKTPNAHNQTNIEDPDRDFVNEYNAFVAKIEGNESKTTMTGEERIQARIQQKLMILEHESQILRDNLFIVTKQKEEMIQTYEKHIQEIEKQNKKLYEENQILKKKFHKDEEKKE